MPCTPTIQEAAMYDSDDDDVYVWNTLGEQLLTSAYN